MIMMSQMVRERERKTCKHSHASFLFALLKGLLTVKEGEGVTLQAIEGGREVEDGKKEEETSYRLKEKLYRTLKCSFPLCIKIWRNFPFGPCECLSTGAIGSKNSCK